MNRVVDCSMYCTLINLIYMKVYPERLIYFHIQLAGGVFTNLCLIVNRQTPSSSSPHLK